MRMTVPISDKPARGDLIHFANIANLPGTGHYQRSRHRRRLIWTRSVMKTKVAVMGSGNIGTDQMFKIIRTSDVLETAATVGVDPWRLAVRGTFGQSGPHG
jgi:hypothetical protein